MKSLLVAAMTIVFLQILIFSLRWRRLHISALNSRWDGREGHGTVDLWDVIGGQLAVVVPIGVGEGARAMEAMKRWPRVCSEITLNKVDLFLYYSEELTGQDELRIPEEASKCFRSTKAITANIAHKAPSDQSQRSTLFYKLFSDPMVSRHFTAHGAIAMLEWSIVVAQNTSFEKLYQATFGNSEPFWVKGSTLLGTEFHETATLPDMQFVLGHLNGNAIYNNSDPSFVEFVDYSRERWSHSFPFDVALWATISDFPYSWPLWQRYASKFTATSLIANVGSHEVSKMCIADAISTDTLFITGGKSVGEADHELDDCTSACGDPSMFDGPPNTSTVCDERCVAVQGRYHAKPSACGAGEASQFGRACRMCYTAREAAVTAKKEAPSSAVDDVIMCDTKRSPEAADCSSKCASSPDAVCDPRCEEENGDRLDCNWRGLGRTCRHCFRDAFVAHIAGKLVDVHGGKTIMCDTLEPPPPPANQRPIDPDATRHGPVSSPSPEDGGEVTAQPEDFAGMEFTKDVTRGQMCAFMPGYAVHLAETTVSVLSVLRFMPGMRVVVSAHPSDFDEYRRTLGQQSPVTIFNSSRVGTSALMADRACGPGTRLIYYMSIGQVLSRAFTYKDTHTPGGDLLVTHTDISQVGEEHARRSLAATALLGVQAPCFTFGSDLILPADTNVHLRQALLSAAAAVKGSQIPEDDPEGGYDYFDILQQFLEISNHHHDLHVSTDVPEMLAVISYSRNPSGVAFVDPKQWSRHNLFSHPSIWDIPLLKPRFGCTIDISIQSQGYNVAQELRKWVDAFHHGASCHQGFVSVAPSDPVFA